MRISPEIVGTQFHPEADPVGMAHHFSQETQRNGIIQKHGLAKFEQIMKRLDDANYLQRTYDRFIPSFIQNAVANLRGEPETVF